MIYYDILRTVIHHVFTLKGILWYTLWKVAQNHQQHVSFAFKNPFHRRWRVWPHLFVKFFVKHCSLYVHQLPKKAGQGSGAWFSGTRNSWKNSSNQIHFGEFWGRRSALYRLVFDLRSIDIIFIYIYIYMYRDIEIYTYIWMFPKIVVPPNHPI